MQRRTMPSIGAIIAVSVFAGLLSQPVLAKKVTIQFAGNYYAVNEQRDWFKKVVDDFNRNSVDVKVNLIQGVSGDKLTAMSAAGKAPDIVQFDRYLMAYWAREGMFAPLEKYLPRSTDVKKEFIPAALQEAMWKGKLYAIPMTSDVRGLFWNKRLLETAGLDGNKGPETWNDLNLYAKKLTVKNANGKVTQAGFVPWGGNWYSYGWIWAFGGDYYDYNTHKPTFTNPKIVDYLKWIGEYAKVNFLPNQQSNKEFVKEGEAMAVYHYGALTGWRKANKKIDTWIGGGECPHPSGGKNGTWAGGMCYAIPSGAKNKAAAGKFLAYLMKPEVMGSFYTLTKEFPPTYKALESIKNQMEPLEAVFMAQLPIANHRRPFTDILQGYLSTAESAVINQKKSPETVVNEIQSDALKQHPSLWREKVVYGVK